MSPPPTRTKPFILLLLLLTQPLFTTAQRGLRVLITNDDGVSSPGIDALAVGLSASPLIASVTVVAPASDRSGAGNHTMPELPAPEEAKTQSGFPVWASPGFPSDCVLWGLGPGGLNPDVVVSGINNGINVGHDVCNSGTVGAARTAVMHGVAGIAISQARPATGADWDFEAAVDIVLQYLEYLSIVMQNKQGNAASIDKSIAASLTSEEDVLAFNVPTCAGTSNPCTPVIVHNAAEIEFKTSQESTELYENQGRTIQSSSEIDTDVEAVRQGYIAVTLITPDLHNINCQRRSVKNP